MPAEVVSPDRQYGSDLARYSSPDTIAWSPSDRFIAFERADWFTFEDGDRIAGTCLWAYDTKRHRAVKLIGHPPHYPGNLYYFHNPQWSPDGKFIAFTGDGVNGQKRIFVHPLLHQSDNNPTPRFDYFDDSDWAAWKPEHAGCDAHVLTLRQAILREPFTPTTETMRIMSPGTIQPCAQIVRLPAKTFTETTGRLLNAHERITPRFGFLSWSPDGAKVVCTLTPSAREFNRYEIWIVGIVDAKMTRVSPVLPLSAGYIAPVWIDDEHIGALSPHGNRFDVVVLTLSTQEVRQIGTIGSSDCDWSQDRSKIVWADCRANDESDLSGSVHVNILNTGVRVSTHATKDNGALE